MSKKYKGGQNHSGMAGLRGMGWMLSKNPFRYSPPSSPSELRKNMLAAALRRLEYSKK